MILSAHQPAYLPWLGFFQKLAISDTFCVLDTAQYSRGEFINRNRIKTARGPLWLTVPVYAHGRPRICDVRIRQNNWRRKHLAAIRDAYGKSPYYDYYAPDLQAAISQPRVLLLDLTDTLLRLVLRWLGIENRLVLASELHVDGKKSEYLVNLCNRLGAKTFVFGGLGRTYANVAAFEAAGIEVRFQEYRHPVYQQRYGSFLPRLSIIDLLFNEGPRSLEILRARGGSDR